MACTACPSMVEKVARKISCVVRIRLRLCSSAALLSEHRPNFYKRARLANKVKWGMREAGYTTRFADTFSYELATLITVTARRKR